MSFKSFSSTLPTGKKNPAVADTQAAPMQDQPAAPAVGKAPVAVPANKA